MFIDACEKYNDESVKEIEKKEGSQYEKEIFKTDLMLE
jgi:hypothetical protein